ncbi:MAG: hypothetical protein V2I36_11035 [Desulfopila sp.]|jgi:hypothetical protein|nr:hypothetical protein [Desulfopila sp.]
MIRIERLQERYPAMEKQVHEGRTSYQSFFDRRERRDLGKGETILHHA